MWLPVIVETIPVNQEVPCKFMFVAFFFFYLIFGVFVRFYSLCLLRCPTIYCGFAAFFFVDLAIC